MYVHSESYYFVLRFTVTMGCYVRRFNHFLFTVSVLKCYLVFSSEPTESGQKKVTCVRAEADGCCVLLVSNAFKLKIKSL